MTRYSTQLPPHIINSAEGNPGEQEQKEPVNPLRTSTIPLLRETAFPKSGETGTHAMVATDTEAQDNAESQDASLTKDESQPETKQDPQADKATSSSTKTTALIVEDTVELAEVLQATLEGMDMQAVYETHGKTGLAKMKEINPKLVLLDIGLPDISGWKILDHIKDHYTDQEAQMPIIIVITAYGDPANRLVGKLQNIYSYLIKPFTPNQVEKLVKKALAGEEPDDPAGTSDDQPAT